ncbi:hypothetical protein VF21_04890 [Pseudogymnoascus sp. 05NY08]|nr:hypothetical protein VF21_04890 [Pseudogymnoascus sp. 05NY08]
MPSSKKRHACASYEPRTVSLRREAILATREGFRKVVECLNEGGGWRVSWDGEGEGEGDGKGADSEGGNAPSALSGFLLSKN